MIFGPSAFAAHALELLRTLDHKPHDYSVHLDIERPDGDVHMDYRIHIAHSRDRKRSKETDFEVRMTDLRMESQGLVVRKSVFVEGDLSIEPHGMPYRISHINWYMVPLTSMYLPEDARIETQLPVVEQMDEGWELKGSARLGVSTASGEPVEIQGALTSPDGVSRVFTSHAILDSLTNWLSTATGSCESPGEKVTYEISAAKA